MEKNPYKVFHSVNGKTPSRVHIVLVRPKNPSNVGSVARALENMGILGRWFVVRSPSIVNADTYKLAKHASERVKTIEHKGSLEEVFGEFSSRLLAIAATGRSGSSSRPHPLRVGAAIHEAIARMMADETEDLLLVFGPESDGLTNEEVRQCHWLATIPTLGRYRSLNLASAVLLFCYEVSRALLEDTKPFRAARSQKSRLVSHFVELARQSGFILPGDPHKMEVRLRTILSKLPDHIEDAKTLHGMLDQAVRSIQVGHIQLKGRYAREFEKEIYGKKGTTN